MRGMDKLISLINKLQDIRNNLSISDKDIQLPQIVVVGSQVSFFKNTLIKALQGVDSPINVFWQF